MSRTLDTKLPADERFEHVCADLFQAQADRKKQAALFSASVLMVEVEVRSYCNRTCWFCPNSFLDRRGERHYLPESIYVQLLEDLAGIRYRRVITFSRYNEPFADGIFYERVAQARACLPGAVLHTNTNGDYLNDDTLNRVYEAGLRSLNIQLYLAPEQALTLETVQPLAERTSTRLGAVRFGPPQLRETSIRYQGDYRDMTLSMYARDFRRDGVNRCGLPIRPRVRRSSPCLHPCLYAYIDYSAHVVPCCNLRSDNPAHAAAVVGKLDATPGSLFALFCSEALVSWRRHLMGFRRKQGLCTDCAFDIIAPTLGNRRAAWRGRRRRR